MSSDFKHTILVTGFGPFNDHAINASWEAVKELSKLSEDSEELKDVKVIIKEIAVSYDDVATCLPKFLEEYQPTMILNVGVSSIAECLTIECRARSNGYVRPDIHSKCPDESAVAPQILETNVDVDQVCKVINKSSKETECSACISYNAGHFLCEYIFHKSLQMKPQRALFVHVPELTKYSSIRTAKGLHRILCSMINSIKDLNSDIR